MLFHPSRGFHWIRFRKVFIGKSSSVNFINVLRARFCTKFWSKKSQSQTYVTKEKLPKRLVYEKVSSKTLMKLTPFDFIKIRRLREIIYILETNLELKSWWIEINNINFFRFVNSTFRESEPSSSSIFLQQELTGNVFVVF